MHKTGIFTKKRFSLEPVAREFEPSEQTIRNWIVQADLDEGRRSDGLTSAEREELRRLRRQVKELRMEREILSKPADGFPTVPHSPDDDWFVERTTPCSMSAEDTMQPTVATIP